MPRISGVNIPDDKRIVIGLTSIYGVGKNSSEKILKSANIEVDTRAKDLSEQEINTLRGILEKSYKIEGDLRQETLLNIKRLKEIASYRGSRHVKNLPCHGQRTKTNSRTVRGNVRRTAGSGRKPSSQKT
ncbi:30S ribosomal protein S13 [Patescibacteria group bacterium]|nr:30S ribosomal protein S13 [Patescibacteria group bacterium]